MKIAIHLAHPAHYHLFKHAIAALQETHTVLVTYNDKDVLKTLIQAKRLGTQVFNIKSPKKGTGSLALLGQFLSKEWHLYQTLRKHRPDVILGTSIIIAHVGKVLGIPSIIVNEDDFDVVAQTVKIGYPFANHILAPACCRVGKWGHKVLAYDSYHELAYLLPQYFTPDPSRVQELAPDGEPFAILRFAELSAHHDFGKTGITEQVARRLVERLARNGKVYITSERALSPALEPYRIQIDPLDIHHALYYASLYVGDSQTMAAEAAVLGTPSIRYNDFVSKISYLDELEHRYRLTLGIPTEDPDRLYAQVEEWVAADNLKAIWQDRQRRLFEEKLDLTALLIWLIENYPQSAHDMQGPPDVMQAFKIQQVSYQA